MNGFKSNVGWVLVYTILVIALLVLLGRPGKTDVAVGQSTPLPVGIADIMKEIQTYRNWLKEDLDEQTRKSIEEKLAMAERDATRMAAYTPVPVSTRTHIVPPTFPEFHETPYVGILNGQGQEFRPREATINNRWSGWVNGLYVVVFAGAYTSDPTHGVLIVHRLSYGKGGGGASSHRTITEEGALRIVSEENARLVIISEKGNTLYFDVPSLRFVSSLEEIVPTSTSTATSTPVDLLKQGTPYP